MTLESLPNHPIFRELPQNRGAGAPVHFEFIYDQIKEARREDDSRLSRGVWQSKLKIADWDEVIRLCEYTLSHTSKDLQILGWLIEAWVIKTGLNGGAKGFGILNHFCQLYWPVLYPNALTVSQDNAIEPDFATDEPAHNIESEASEIAEQRQNILDWLDHALQNRLLFIELTPDLEFANLPALTLANWVEAVDLDKRQRRNAATPQVNDNSTKPTLADFRRALNLAPMRWLLALQHDVNACHATLIALCQTLDTLDLPQRTHFMGTRKQLDDMITILDNAVTRRQPETNMPDAKAETITTPDVQGKIIPTQNTPPSPPPSDETQLISQREDAYRALQELSAFLAEVDPHSPAPYLLELIVSWQNKNLLQIVNDINSGETDAHALLKLLSSVGSAVKG